MAPEQPEEGQWILGFDDGDIKRYETSFLLTCLQHSALNKLESGGLILNKSAAPCIDFLYMKGTAKGSEKKLCGVFIASTDARKAFDLEVYSEFHMNPFAFSPASRERRTSGQSMQDRLGLHTFRRGDVVVYTLAEPHEEMSMMCVWGLCDEPAKLSSDDSAKVQARKVLVLYDFAAKIFFVGAWSAWRRVPDPAKVSSDGESFHCDKDDQVKVINRDQCEEMARQCSQLPPHALLGSLAKMQKDAQKPPPSLEVARNACYLRRAPGIPAPKYTRKRRKRRNQ